MNQHLEAFTLTQEEAKLRGINAKDNLPYCSCLSVKGTIVYSEWFGDITKAYTRSLEFSTWKYTQ